jgi:hypothetical protein
VLFGQRPRTILKFDATTGLTVSRQRSNMAPALTQVGVASRLSSRRQATLPVSFLSSVRIGLIGGVLNMSVLDDFVRIRLYRTRASEFELLAETEPLSEARVRYRIVARHYRELADREEQSDKARMAECLELLKLARREAAE